MQLFLSKRQICKNFINKSLRISIIALLFILLLDLTAFMLLPYSFLYAGCTKATPASRTDAVAILFHDFDATSMTGLDRETERRMNYGIGLINDNKGKYLIVAGGNKAASEIKGSGLMKKYAVDKSIPTQDILIETKSRDTIGNLTGIQAILAAKKLTDYTLVSSPYHLKRIALLANSNDKQPTLAPYDPKTSFPHLTRLEIIESAHYNLAALLAQVILSDKIYTEIVGWVRENTDF